MPEYLAPGVYVEEYEANPQPIPGVSTSIDDATARALIDRFKDLVPPDWTGYNASDPGITLVKLFAWLAEALLYRTGGATDARREAAVRELLPLLGCGPPKRPRYFEGQIIDRGHAGGRAELPSRQASAPQPRAVWLRSCQRPRRAGGERAATDRTSWSIRAMRSIRLARPTRFARGRSCACPAQLPRPSSRFAVGTGRAVLSRHRTAPRIRASKKRA